MLGRYRIKRASKAVWSICRLCIRMYRRVGRALSSSSNSSSELCPSSAGPANTSFNIGKVVRQEGSEAYRHASASGSGRKHGSRQLKTPASSMGMVF